MTTLSNINSVRASWLNERVSSFLWLWTVVLYVGADQIVMVIKIVPLNRSHWARLLLGHALVTLTRGSNLTTKENYCQCLFSSFTNIAIKLLKNQFPSCPILHTGQHWHGWSQQCVFCNASDGWMDSSALLITAYLQSVYLRLRRGAHAMWDIQQYVTTCQLSVILNK